MRLPAALPPLPPSRLVDVGGRSLEAVVAGTTRPPILLVNGAGGPLVGWARVFGPLAALGTVVAYNRPGVGRSAPPTRAQTSGAVVDDLLALAKALELARPWVVVGHSLGGLHVQLLARRHPEAVAGVVLVESAHRADRTLGELQPGWLRTVNRLLGPRRPDPLDETANVDASIAELDAAPPFPEIPLVVVSGGRRPPRLVLPDVARDARLAGQRELVALTSSGEHVVARDSGHFPQLTEPRVVVEAVRRVVERAR